MKKHIPNAVKCFLTFMTVITILCMMPFTTIASDDDIFGDDFTVSQLYTQQHKSYPDSMAADSDAELPKGWLLWHSYSEYASLDSKLYLRTPDGSIKEISGDFIHAMNGSFGIMPEQITFMAIDSSADEWDIFLYDNGNITNLTRNSGFRNEDPKWSPDGNQIVFKRGYWDNSVGDFVYDLAMLNIDTCEVTMLTNDLAEEAMPVFSEDGKFIYYTRYTDGIGSICCMDLTTHETEDIYSETNVTAYYPIIKGEQLYFTKWYSAENHCDQLMRYDGSNITVLPFNSEQYDCSDPCPVKGDAMIYSSTSKVGYDLYYYDGRKSVRLTELCSDKNELGADYYSLEEYENYLDNSRIMGDVNGDGEFNIADLVLFQKWLLAVPDAELVNWKAANFCKDERLDVFDLCFMRKALIEAENDNSIIVSNIDELSNAVKNAKAGDVIKVAPGIYDVSSKTISSESDGTENAPITLTALDKNDPPVLTGSTTEHGYVLHILGDYWVLGSLICQNSQKGIVLDNSNHTVIQNCEIHTLGMEAIAVRDGSSYCAVKSCYIHDTGLVKPGYGEGVYIGSAKSNDNFDHYCDHNKVIGCTFKNVAAEHVDVKEYTTDTEISGCIFYGDGMAGENSAGSFIDLKGNDCYVHDNIGYRNGNPKIVAAFEIHKQVEDWGYHHIFENNILYMDQPYSAENTSRRMYVVDGWFSDFSVKNNQVDYGDGLVPADSREYYNSGNVTYMN